MHHEHAADLVFMAILNPYLLLALAFWTSGMLTLGYWKGGKDERADWIKQQAKAAEQARENEQELTRMNNRSTALYVARARDQERKARALPKIEIPMDCTVPAAAGRVLNDAQRLPEDAGAGPGIGAAAEAVDSSCAAELEICKRNYVEVAIPNALQLQELQQRWRDTQSIINQVR